MAYSRAQLFQDVLDDTNREDKADRLPQWLASAAFRINGKLRDDRMIKRALLPITEMVFPVPPNYQAPSSLTVRTHKTNADGTPALGDKIGTAVYMPPDQIDSGASKPGEGLPPRGPRWYTNRGRFIELGDWNATGPFQIELFYYADLDELPNDTSSNWLLDLAPHVYKDAMLHFAFLHLQEDDRSNSALIRMSAEIDFLNDQNEARKLQNTGPLIQRPTAGFGARSNVRRYR